MKLNRVFSAVLVAAAICLPFTAAEADDLQKIENAGKLSVALCGAFQPFSIVDKNNKVVGFDVDIGSEIARRLKADPNIVTTAWDGIIAGLVTGRYETIIGSMSITEKRKKAIDFVGPYYRSGRPCCLRSQGRRRHRRRAKGQAGRRHAGRGCREMTMLIMTHEMRFAAEVPDHVLFMDGGGCR